MYLSVISITYEPNQSVYDFNYEPLILFLTRVRYCA